jgi:pimeloyl-ACP methyl ester carboxylesterase
MGEAREEPTVVLVHGAWHGAWCWDEVVARLDADSVSNIAVDLPMTSLADDVAATRAAIDAADGPVVLVGHSYGGVVISEAGNHPAVRHLVYLCALAVDSGRSAASSVEDDSLPGTALGDAFRVADDGLVTVEPGSVVECFYADCDPDLAAAAADRLRPIAFGCLTDTVSHAAWHDRPSTYVVCTEDAAVHPEVQRVLARNCTDVVEWSTSHSPFLSQPDLVSDLLVTTTRTEHAGS